MNDAGSFEVPVAPAVSDVQRRAIVGLADIRRGGQALVSELGSITHDPIYADAPEPLRDTWQDQSTLITHIMQGIEVDPTAEIGIVETHLATANRYRNIAPNLAALHFAKAAFLQQSSNLPYEESLALAKQCRELSQAEGITHTTPGDFLPDAYILLIAKNAAQGVDLPSPDVIAQATRDDRTLIQDYALVLPEDKRPEFVGAFPEDEQGTLSLQLDTAVSAVLDSDLITSPEDQAQRQQVIERVMEAFSQSLGTLGQTDAHPQGREPGSRWTGKQIMETLANLGGDDSVRILKDISEQTTSQLKALNKQLKKRSASERTQLMRPFMSFTARVLDTLVEVDTKRGGVLAMRYLEMTALPDRLFTHFTQKLVEREYFSATLVPFLKDCENIPVLKRIMSKYGSQFNTIVGTLEQIPDYSADHNLVARQEELFEALADLGTLTPRIFERYRQKSPDERKAFAQRIRMLKPQFFRNIPIKGILDPQDRDILTEMVYVAYKPMGMSFEKVAELIQKIDDQTDDVARYTFPEDGYPVTLERKGRYEVKERQQVDIQALRRYRDLFTTTQSDQTVEQAPDAESSLLTAFRSILTPAPEAQQSGSSRTEPADMALRQLLAPFSAEPRIQEFLGRSQEVTLDNAHETASELAEIMGVYFQDNYQRLLTDYFTSHEDAFGEVVSFLGQDRVRNLLTEQFAQSGDIVDWSEFERAIHPPVQDRLKQLITTGTSNMGQPYVASLLARFVEHAYIAPIQKSVKTELTKFTATAGDGGYASRGGLKAYISKNVGSFFAKAAAGLCTAEDIPLFNRDDHFHINVVEGDETVRANVQAYVATIGGKPSLVLRGFNPTADWVGKIDIASFCDQIIAIGKEFQTANGLAGVYITTQGSWHALSNRDQVGRYLVGRYHGKSGIPTSLKVSESHTVQTVYSV